MKFEELNLDERILRAVEDMGFEEAEWEEKAKDLASRFIKNFVKYEGNEAEIGRASCRERV